MTPLATIEIPEAVKRLHRTLSPRAERFLEAVERRGDELSPLLHSTSELPRWTELYAYPVQSWPLFIEGDKLRALHRAARGMAHLLRRLPKTLFDDDPARIARFYRMDSELWAMALLQEPSGLEGAVMRGDFIETVDGLKCIECNTTGCLGGWQVRFFAHDIRDEPLVAEHLEGPGGEAVYVDPIASLFRHLLSDGRRTGIAAAAGALNVAILVADTVPEDELMGVFGYLDPAWRAWLSEHGDGLTGRLSVARTGEIEGRRGRAWLHGFEVQAVIEYHDPVPRPAVFRAFKAGRLNMYNSPLLTLLGDKRNLALLSSHQDSDRFTSDERELIRELVPWTRIVAPGEVEWRSRRVDLEELLCEERERLVVKDAFGTQGQAVYIGRTTPPERWEEVVGQALASDHWIVQEELESLPYWAQSAAGVPGPQDIVWGLITFGSEYAGTFLRMAPKGGRGVVNSATGAAEGVLLEIGGGPEPAAPVAAPSTLSTPTSPPTSPTTGPAAGPASRGEEQG